MSSLSEEQKRRIEANRQRALAIRREKMAAATGSASSASASSQSKIYSKTNMPVSSNTFNNKPHGSPSIHSNAPNRQVSSTFASTSSSMPVKSTNVNHPIKNSVSSTSNTAGNNSSAPLQRAATSSFESNSIHQGWRPHNNSVSGPTFLGNKSNIQTNKPWQSSYAKEPKVSESNSNNSRSLASQKNLTPAQNTTTNYGGNSTPTFTGPVVTGTFCLCSKDTFVAEVPYHSELIKVFKTVPSNAYDPNTKRWSFSIDHHDQLVNKVKALRPGVCVSALPAYVLKVLKEARLQPPLHSIDISGLDPLLRDALLPFQLDGVRFGVRREGRVLIADDMGLGKTIQALGIAACYRRDWPLLIVSPSSVRYSWQRALERWVSSFNCCVINTTQDPLTGFDVIITSYDLLSRRAKEFASQNFGVVIMDESHMLKNFKSARYKAAAPLVKRARRVILLSGTPALSRPSELYTQIASVDNKLFPNHQDYGIRYCAGKMTPWGWDFTGSSNLTELQILLQSKIMIRRLKTEVLDQLPGKQRKVVMLDPVTIEKSNNEALTESAKQLGLQSLKGSDRHSALLQFFSHTAHAKRQAVSDYVEELLEAGHKFLIFAHHKVMLEALCQTCERSKAMYIRVEGSTAGDVRQALVDEFQKRDDVRVAVLSITAASSGITLTAAKLVVFAELYWNPGILVQAEDRVHRIGQRDSVDVHYLVARGTADDYIWPMVQQKLNILGKAGLSKDDFSDSDATHQKRDEANTLLSYLVDLKPEELAEMEQEFDSDVDLQGGPTKKFKTDV